jgi:hypothetical protein
MKQIVLSVFIVVVVFASCSSADSDAEKAANLNRKSMEYAKELKLEEAEKLYKESREIIARYKDMEKFVEFYTAYNKYMATTVEK